jgi:prepilin-type N-terminal cleavage/methylation domain-containing protein
VVATSFREEHAFTLVEVLIAMVLITVGVMGTVALVDNANARTSDTKGREGATSLARDLIESTRTLPFANINDSDAPAQLQARGGLADADPAAGWQIKRRNFTYTVAISSCTIDDSSDGYGTAASHDSTFCAGTLSSTSGSADRNPSDFKRVRYTVSWRDTRGPQQLTQAALINSTYRGPAVSRIEAAPVFADEVSLTATFSSSAETAKWYLDGRLEGPIDGSPGTVWEWDWDLGPACVKDDPASIQDGVYSVGAIGYDGNGATGGIKSANVTINRCAAYAPTGLRGGRNWDGVELTWARNQEPDVTGYDVFRGTTRVCSTASVNDTTCRDDPPSSSATYTYTVQAYDNGPLGRRASDASAALTVLPDCAAATAPCNTPPAAPDVSSSNGVLSISAGHPDDADQGDAVEFFRVYRTSSPASPSSPGDRYDLVDNTGATVTWADKAPGSFYYWVTAVDRHYAESDFSVMVR